MKKNLSISFFSLILFFAFSCSEVLNKYPNISGKWRINITTTSSTCPAWLVPNTYSMIFTITQEEDYITAVSDENFTYEGTIDNNGNFTLKVLYDYEGYHYEVSLEGKVNDDSFSGTGYTKINGDLVSCEAKFTFTGIKLENL